MPVMTNVTEAASELAALIEPATRIVAFTGAGASAASGVPTYRGAGGSWTRFNPNRYASIEAFRSDPSYYWEFFVEERYPGLVEAHPNPVHHALAALEDAEKLTAIITQNIDGLHQAAGSREVIELHGNTRRYYCQDCGHETDFEVVRKLIDAHVPPHCPGCGEPQIRPAVVFFGETLAPEVLATASDHMARADLVLAIGSSLIVQPAASLPVEGLEAGAKLVILNADATPLDKRATLAILAPADEVLALAVPTAG